MGCVKTAVSLEKSLFERAEGLARRMYVSRSRLFTLAVQDFIDRRQSRELLRRINAAFEGEDPAEQSLRSRIRRSHRCLVEGQWQFARATSSRLMWTDRS